MTPNIDYLCIIRESAGRTTFETIDIPVSVELISKLEGMANNPNVTVLDMQAQLNSHYAESERCNINYISPNFYGASYIDIARYPASYSFNRYNELLREHQEQYLSRLNVVPEDLDRRLAEETDAYAMQLKKTYLCSAKRFICAYNYTQTLNSVKRMKDVRMYSTDTLGWSDFSYKVTDAISISLGTNFGYGTSSYFHLVVRFNGIEILPYSYITRYYFANIRDLKRYTRRYEATHDSWNTAFDFVAKTANFANASPRKFLEEWVLNEVKEMVHGLHAILEDPRFTVEDWINKAGKDTDCDYLTVRNMYADEKKCFSVYPEEMTMAVQAEKITGALEFLENLSSLATHIPDIDDFISEIKRMAVCVIPRLDAMVRTLNSKLAELRKQKGNKEDICEELDTDLAQHREAISEQFEARSEERKEWSRSDFETEYTNTHPEYKVLSERKQMLSREIYDLACEISQRDEFRRSLVECRGRVENAGLINTTLAA